MTSVVSGWAGESTCARSSGSALATNRSRLRRIRVRPQRLREHARAEVGAADADVDHGAQRLAGVSPQALAAHRVAERAHTFARTAHQRHHVRAGGKRLRRCAQRDVQHGAIFAGVDVLAREHARAPAFDIGLAREAGEQRQRFVGHSVLGIVEQQAARLER